MFFFSNAGQDPFPRFFFRILAVSICHRYSQLQRFNPFEGYERCRRYFSKFNTTHLKLYKNTPSYEICATECRKKTSFQSPSQGHNSLHPSLYLREKADAGCSPCSPSGGCRPPSSSSSSQVPSAPQQVFVSKRHIR